MHLNCSLTMTATPRNLVSTLIAKKSRVPYVVHLRGTLSVPTGKSLGSRFYRWAYRTMFKGAAAIIALGQPSYRSVLELGDFADKAVPLLPNFVDFRSVQEKVPRTESCEELRVIFTGALVESKGIYTVVEAAELVQGAHFQLVGDGPPESRKALLQHILDRGLQERVQVLGPVTNREVLSMLRDSDVFVFPTWTEGFPNSVSEAMGVGLPVVASPVGAIPEMIDVPEGGYLAAPDDIQELRRGTDSPARRAFTANTDGAAQQAEGPPGVRLRHSSEEALQRIHPHHIIPASEEILKIAICLEHEGIATCPAVGFCTLRVELLSSESAGRGFLWKISRPLGKHQRLLLLLSRTRFCRDPSDMGVPHLNRLCWPRLVSRASIS